MTAHKGQIKEQFARSAGKYVTSKTHAAGADLARLVELVAPNEEGRLLDVATGGGHVALAVAPHMGLTVASDLTRGMLKEARRFITGQGLPSVIYCAADAEFLPFHEATFDAVTCRIALHHVSNLNAVLKDFYRVLDEGGCFGFVDSMVPDEPPLADFMNRMETLRDPTHIRSQTLQEWTALLESAGFRIEAAEVFKKVHDFDAWAKRSSYIDESKREYLEEAFLKAPSRAVKYFRFHIEGGRLISYTDDKLLLLGRKD
jgi:ubiquinone/menaquinone biosynthesis C-methylase UbiE